MGIMIERPFIAWLLYTMANVSWYRRHYWTSVLFGIAYSLCYWLDFRTIHKLGIAACVHGSLTTIKDGIPRF